MKELLYVCSIIGFVLLLVYTAYMRVKKGYPLKSLSETAYIAKQPTTFTLIMSLVAFLITPQLIAKSEGWWGMLGMIYFIGMLMVAASPHYRKGEHALHFAGARLAAVASQFLILMRCWPIMLVWVLYLIYYIRVRKDNTLYAEACCMLAMMIYCLR